MNLLPRGEQRGGWGKRNRQGLGAARSAQREDTALSILLAGRGTAVPLSRSTRNQWAGVRRTRALKYASIPDPGHWDGTIDRSVWCFLATQGVVRKGP
jgi:hypothetical protein